MSRFPALALLLCVIVAPGCNERKEPTEPIESAAAASAMPRSRAKPIVTRRHDRNAPLEQFVQQHVEQAEVTGSRVLVYVGATWCEPCKRFHKALEAGELDEPLAGTHFLEFDADDDRSELRAAGYASKYIPLFSVPDSSGHSTSLSIEGSIKGDKAVKENLVPRLLALLEGKVTE
jgi:thiol-disulfide isomerase/thioredoxin